MDDRLDTRLAIIIINFRTPELTVDCLRSLRPEVAANPGTRVVLVENGSGDDSEARLRAAIEANGWGSWCTMIAAEKNWGFAGGNNRGWEHVQKRGGAKFVLLLNSDTIVHPGCLAHCLGVMEKEPTIGALTCQLVSRDGSPQNVCRRFPTPLRCLVGSVSLPWKMPRLFGWADCEDPSWDRRTVVRDVDWIAGAFMMLRGEWVSEHGLLDERFFFYSEDVEICHRIWKSGLRCRYDPRVTIVHLGGASSDPSRMATGAKSIHAWRGRYMAQRICYGRLAGLVVQVTDLANVGVRIGVGWMLGRGKTEVQQVMLEDWRTLVRNWGKWSGSPT